VATAPSPGTISSQYFSFVIFIGLSMSFNRDRFLHKGASARRDSKGKRAPSWSFAPFISARLAASAIT
jgi:hypothetical protein